MSKLLHDLFELEKFATGIDACISENELWDRYGKAETLSAIETGLLEHRRIKFREGHGRCVCWLSEQGREYARSESGISTKTAN